MGQKWSESHLNWAEARVLRRVAQELGRLLPVRDLSGIENGKF